MPQITVGCIYEYINPIIRIMLALYISENHAFVYVACVQPKKTLSPKVTIHSTGGGDA